MSVNTRVNEIQTNLTSLEDQIKKQPVEKAIPEAVQALKEYGQEIAVFNLENKATSKLKLVESAETQETESAKTQKDLLTNVQETWNRVNSDCISMGITNLFERIGSLGMQISPQELSELQHLHTSLMCDFLSNSQKTLLNVLQDGLKERANYLNQKDLQPATTMVPSSHPQELIPLDQPGLGELSMLPDEALENILSFLPLEDLYHLSLTSKDLNSLSDTFFKRLARVIAQRKLDFHLDNNFFNTATLNNRRILRIVEDKGCLICESPEHDIEVWDLKTKECLAELKGHADKVGCLELTKDLLISGSRDQMIKVWDLKTKSCLATLTGHTDTVCCLLVVKDLLFSGSDDKSIKVWDLKTMKFLNTLQEHSASIDSLLVVEDLLISKSNDGMVKAWDPNTMKCLWTLKDVSCLQCKEDRLFCGFENGTIGILDPKNGKALSELNGHDNHIKYLEIEGDYLISQSKFYAVVKIWNLKTMECLVTYDIFQLMYLQRVERVDRPLFSRSTDGRTLNVFNPKTMLSVISSNKMITCIKTAGDRLFSADLTNNAFSETSSIKVWDVRTMKCLGTLEGFNGYVQKILVAEECIITESLKTSITNKHIRTIKIFDFSDPLAVLAHKARGFNFVVGYGKQLIGSAMKALKK